MIMPGSVVVIPWRIATEIHSGGIQALHNKTGTVDTHSWGTGVIPDVRSRSYIIVSTRYHRIDAVGLSSKCCSDAKDSHIQTVLPYGQARQTRNPHSSNQPDSGNRGNP